jgi:hypothetical protein
MLRKISHNNEKNTLWFIFEPSCTILYGNSIDKTNKITLNKLFLHLFITRM